MDDITPQCLISPKEETIRFLQTFARTYLPGKALPLEAIARRWDKQPEMPTC